MTSKITAPRGTRDLLPEDAPAWDRVETVARDLARRYAFDRVEGVPFTVVSGFGPSICATFTPR